MTEFGRRRVLGAVGGSVLAGLAGCSQLPVGGGDGDEETDTDDGGSPVQTDVEGWPKPGRTATNRLYDADGTSASGSLEGAWSWEYDVPDEVQYPGLNYGGPVAVDGTVYSAVSGQYEDPTTDTDDPTFVNEVVGIDAESGEQVASMPFLTDVKTYSPGLLSPVVDDGQLYFGSAGLFAFDLSSEEQAWENRDVTVYGQVAVADGTLYTFVLAEEDVRFAAFDAADGSRQWRSDPMLADSLPPAVTGDTVYVPDGPELVALDAADGSERWRTNAGVRSYVLRPGTDDATYVSPPAVGEDAVYVAGGLDTAIQGDGGALVALDRETGEEQWSFRPENDAEGRYSLVAGIPALHDGMLYATGAPDVDPRSGSETTELYAVDASDGSLEWRTEVPSLSLYVAGSGDSVVVVTPEGTAAYAAADGSPRGELAEGKPPDVTTGNPVLDGRVFTKVTNGVAGYEFG